jgi:hypothetical protein
LEIEQNKKSLELINSVDDNNEVVETALSNACCGVP